DGRAPVLLEPARQRRGRERLVDRVERAGEEARLLAGGDHQDVTRRETIARGSGERPADHIRRNTARRETPRGQRERCEGRRDDPRYHPSLLPCSSPRVRRTRPLETQALRYRVPATRRAGVRPCGTRPRGTLQAPTPARWPPAAAAGRSAVRGARSRRPGPPRCAPARRASEGAPAPTAPRSPRQSTRARRARPARSADRRAPPPSPSPGPPR